VSSCFHAALAFFAFVVEPVSPDFTSLVATLGWRDTLSELGSGFFGWVLLALPMVLGLLVVADVLLLVLLGGVAVVAEEPLVWLFLYVSVSAP